MKEYNTKLKGIHRPFSKALKSLCWIARFVVKSKGNISPSSFYVSFYIYILRETSRRNTNILSKEQKGYFITNEISKKVLDMLKGLEVDALKERIRQILSSSHKNTVEDKLIYSTYKKCSYYITLAKSTGILTKEYTLSQDGKKLANLRSTFFKLSKEEKRIIGSAIFLADPLLLVSIAITRRWEAKYNELETPLYQLFLKQLNEEALFIYIKSHQENYVEVINSWFDQIDLFDKRNHIRKYWKIKLTDILPEDIKARLNSILPIFEREILIPYSKLEKQYKLILKTYEEKLLKNKETDGFVNLYDIKKSFRMSYERFNILMDKFSRETRSKYIVLVSNIVNSIDRRRRFIIDNKVALSVKIIKK